MHARGCLSAKCGSKKIFITNKTSMRRDLKKKEEGKKKREILELVGVYLDTIQLNRVAAHQSLVKSEAGQRFNCA